MKPGSMAKYIGTSLSGINPGGLLVVSVDRNSIPVWVVVRDSAGMTWTVQETELEEIPEKTESKVEDLVALKAGGFSVDDILRLNEAGLL